MTMLQACLRTRRRWVAAGLLGLLPLLAVADTDEPVIAQHPAVAAADWSAVQEVVIELGDHSYTPGEISFKLGVPYKLRLRNVGGTAHDMVGGTFFSEQVIALKMVNSRVGRIMADQINSIYLRPKNDTELWFVALKEGEFSFFCSIPGHRDSGMEGTVRVTR